MINSLNQTTSQTNAIGLLTVDSNRKMVSLNRKFIEMWGLPPQIVKSRDEKLALEFAYSQLKNPKNFIKEVQGSYIRMESEIHDTIKFKDGRVFKRISQPQYFQDEIVARIWEFQELIESDLSQKLYQQRHLLYQVNSFTFLKK
jgi:hypothetical protein